VGHVDVVDESDSVEDSFLNTFDTYVPVEYTNCVLSILVPVSLKVGEKLKIDFDILEDNNQVTMSSHATVLWQGKRSGKQMFKAGLSFNNLEDIDKQSLGLYIRNRLLT